MVNPAEVGDLYKSLGIDIDATDNQIIKSYRKLALKHHPDRGGNSAAFQKISKAYEILTDKKQKAEYDKHIRKDIEIKKRHKVRHEQMDAKRQKLKEELLRREKEYADAMQSNGPPQSSRSGTTTSSASSRRQPKEPSTESNEESLLGRTIRLKWDEKKYSHSDETLAKIFRFYGHVTAIKIGENGKSGKVVFQFSKSAIEAVRVESHKVEQWKDVSILGHIFTTKEREKKTDVYQQEKPTNTEGPTMEEYECFEKETIAKMRAIAAKRKQEKQKVSTI